MSTDAEVVCGGNPCRGGLTLNPIGASVRLKIGPGKENFDVKAGRSSFVFIKEEGD